jgi:hypothetical protein
MFPTDDKHLDVKAAAAQLGVPPAIIYANLDEFPRGVVWRVGRTVRVSASRLSEWRDRGGSLGGAK